MIIVLLIALLIYVILEYADIYSTDYYGGKYTNQYIKGGADSVITIKNIHPSNPDDKIKINFDNYFKNDFVWTYTNSIKSPYIISLNSTENIYLFYTYEYIKTHLHDTKFITRLRHDCTKTNAVGLFVYHDKEYDSIIIGDIFYLHDTSYYTRNAIKSMKNIVNIYHIFKHGDKVGNIVTSHVENFNFEKYSSNVSFTEYSTYQNNILTGTGIDLCDAFSWKNPGSGNSYEKYIETNKTKLSTYNPALKSLGSTCYLNSALQAFRCVPVFRYYIASKYENIKSLLDTKPDESHKTTLFIALFNELYEFLQNIEINPDNDNEAHIQKLYNLLKKLEFTYGDSNKKYYNDLSIKDSTESYRHLLFIVGKADIYPLSKSHERRIRSLLYMHNPDDRAIPDYIDARMQSHNAFDQLNLSLVQITHICPNIKKFKSTFNEVKEYLSFEIPDMNTFKSLEDYLRLSYKEDSEEVVEYIIGDNDVKYLDETMITRNRIIHLGNVLVFQLARQFVDIDESKRVNPISLPRRVYPISLPNMIDLTEYCVTEKYYGNQNPNYYKFYKCAQVMHVAEHYYTYGKNYVNGKWYVFNDAYMVRETTEDITKPDPRVSYVIYYRDI